MVIENLYLASILTFIGACIIDFSFIWYMHYANNLKEYSAGMWAIIIGAPSIFGTKNYVNSDIVALCYLFGLGFGTVVAVKYLKWKKQK